MAWQASDGLSTVLQLARAALARMDAHAAPGPALLPYHSHHTRSHHQLHGGRAVGCQRHGHRRHCACLAHHTHTRTHPPQELQRDGTAVSFVHVAAEDGNDMAAEHLVGSAAQTGPLRFVSKCTGGAFVHVHHVMAEHRSHASTTHTTDLFDAALRCGVRPFAFNRHGSARWGTCSGRCCRGVWTWVAGVCAATRRWATGNGRTAASTHTTVRCRGSGHAQHCSGMDWHDLHAGV